MRERGVTVIANAGGVNPIACAREVLRLAPGLKVAVVLGDDVYHRLDDFLAKGYPMRDMDTGEPLAAVRDRILSANAYIGAFPLAEALATGADVVIAGRSTDTALALAPMVHRYHWSPGPITTNSPPAPSPATSSNAAHNAPAVTARWIGNPFPTWRTSATPSSRPIPTAPSS